MADNKKAIALGLGVLGLLTIAYAVAGPSNAAPNTGLQQVGPGGFINYGGQSWQNTTGNPVWLNATGMLVNAAGNIMGNIADILAALNHGGGGAGPTGGNANPDSGQGHYQDVNGEYTWVPNVGVPGYYFNPSPSSLM